MVCATEPLGKLAVGASVSSPVGEADAGAACTMLVATPQLISTNCSCWVISGTFKRKKRIRSATWNNSDPIHPAIFSFTLLIYGGGCVAIKNFVAPTPLAMSIT